MDGDEVVSFVVYGVGSVLGDGINPMDNEYFGSVVRDGLVSVFKIKLDQLMEI